MSHPVRCDAVTIRGAYPDDTCALRRLAALDSQRLRSIDLLVAEIDGELVAAVALDQDWTIADPFRPTAAVVDLLRARAAQLRRTGKHASAGPPTLSMPGPISPSSMPLPSASGSE